MLLTLPPKHKAPRDHGVSPAYSRLATQPCLFINCALLPYLLMQGFIIHSLVAPIKHNALYMDFSWWDYKSTCLMPQMAARFFIVRGQCVEERQGPSDTLSRACKHSSAIYSALGEELLSPFVLVSSHSITAKWISEI